VINRPTASCSACSEFTFRPAERFLGQVFIYYFPKYFPEGTNQATTASLYVLTFVAQYSELMRASLNKPTINKINICLWMSYSMKDMGRLLLFMWEAYIKNWPSSSGAMSHWPFNFHCIYYLRYLVGNSKRLLSSFHYNVTCSNIFCCFEWGKSNT
jgi:hypothetical protein